MPGPDNPRPMPKNPAQEPDRESAESRKDGSQSKHQEPIVNTAGFKPGELINPKTFTANPNLVRLTREEARRVASSFIVAVPHETTDHKVVEISYTFAPVARLIRDEEKRKRSNQESSGEPVSGIIPKDFIDAYIASKLKQDHRMQYTKRVLAPYVQELSRELGQFSSISPNRLEQLLYVLDILITKTPTQAEVEADPTLADQSTAIIHEHDHSRLALKDPLGYVMSIIRDDAAKQGVTIEVHDDQMAKRLAKFERERYRREHSKQRPLAEPGETQE
jgi:hypothetical protein